MHLGGRSKGHAARGAEMQMAREPLFGDAMFRVLCVHVIAAGMWEGRTAQRDD